MNADAFVRGRIASLSSSRTSHVCLSYQQPPQLEEGDQASLIDVTSNLNSCKFKKEAYRDGIKRKGDKIGMGYMKHG